MYNIKLAGLDTGKSYYVKVRAKVFGYQDSEWSYPFKFETPKDTMPPGRVEQVSFISEGDSFIAKWDAPSVNEDGVTPCGDVSHYKITLKDLDRNVTRHEKTNDTSFTLDFNRNKQLFGNAAGRIELTVWAVDFSGNEGKTVVVIAQNPPPAKVKNVTAAVSVESVALKWDANTENDLANYEIHVGSTSGFTPSASTLRAKVAAGTDTFTYDTASLSVLYFKIIAVDKFNQKSEPSDVVSAQPRLTTDYDKEPPGTVTGFTVTQVLAADNASATAQINYTAVADADLDKYEVQYRKTGETTLPWSFAAIPSDQTMAEIKPLPLATSYDFRIRAVDFNANKGDWSAVVVAPGVKKTTLPAAPTGVTVRGGLTNLMITWTASTDPSMANWAGTYEVQISKATTFTSPTTIKTSSTLASFINLDANTVYYVRIRSIDPYNNTGAWSATANGNTGQVADANSSRVIWSDTQPATGKTNDLWIKVPDNVQYRFDGTNWVKAQDTELAGAIDNVRQTADGKNKAWYQTTKPPATNNTQGDLWFDTANGNKLHVWSTSANDWVSAQDAAIQDALDNADEALQTADGKNTIFYTAPASGVTPREGDTWFDNAVIKVYKNGAWVNASDDLDTAKARQAIQIAGSKNKTYYVAKDSATGMIEGDILFDTADGNKQYRYNGTAWVSVQDAAIEAAESAAGQAQETADKKNTIYYSTPPTTGLRDGDTWFDGPTIKTYRNGVWTDSSSNLETQQGADAIQIAGSKNKTFYTTYANRPTTGLTEGDLLFDTGNKYKQYRYTNAGWLSVQDGTIADAKTAADNAQTAANTAITNASNAFNLADGKAQVFWGGTRPSNLVAADAGDIWVDTAKTPNEIQVWSGTAWSVTGDPATKAIAEAANTLAGQKSYTYIENSAPTAASTPAPTKGDIWIKNNVTPNEVSVYTGSAWVASGDKAARDAAATKAYIFTTTNDTAPTSPAPKRGDIWINTTSGLTKVRTATNWVLSTDPEARNIANSKITTYYNVTAPTAPTGGFTTGDLWVRTTDNRLHRWAGSWVELKDKSITDLESLTEDIVDDLIPGLETQLDNKIEVYVQNDSPAITNAAKQKGDIWIRPDNGEVKVYSGTAWVVSTDPAAKALADTAQTTADKKMQTFYGTTGPANNPAGTLKVNDLWIHSGTKRLHRWNGTIWEEVKDADITAAQQAAATANQAVGNLAGTVGDLTTQVDNKVEVWFQTNQPAVPSSAADRLKMKGDIWINTSTGASNGEVKIYPGTGTTWNVVTDPAAIAAAQAAKDVADSKRQVFGGELAPSNTTGTTGNNLQVNDLWIRDSDKKMHRWGGNAWEIAQDKRIEEVDSKGTDLVINGTGSMGDTTNWGGGVIFDPSDTPPGMPGAFVATGPTSVRSDQLIPVDPNRRYKLSALFKSNDSDKVTGGYFGLHPHDSSGLSMSPHHYMFQSGTTTELTQPLNDGDTKIHVKDASNWNNSAGSATHLRTIIFWNYVDPFGKLWAPKTYSRNAITNAYADGAIDKTANVITLSSPYSGDTIPAGTQLSNGSSGGNYLYAPLSGQPFPSDEWERREAILEKSDWSTDLPYRTQAVFSTGLPPGAAYVKILLLMNWSVFSDTGASVKFSGISFSDASAAQDMAISAMDSANSRNRNIYSTGNATGSSLNGYSFIDGDTWYRRDANNTIVGMWEFVGGAWVSKTLNNQVIANLDAGKINAGTINADRIGAKSIDTSKIVVGGLDASVVVEDGTITATQIAGETITASELAAGAVTADKIKANEIDASKIVSGGMDGSVVIEEGTITATEIAGQTITGDKIQGNTIDAGHIKAGSITIGTGKPIAPGTVATPSDVSTAKSEAISTASGDATTKANAAQAAAIQAAATDAQTKANNAKAAAEQAAKDYADGQITQAEADAIAAAAADAQAKADAAKQAAIQAAATDATTKANNAKSQAITEAGTAADTKVANAVSPINTKLNTWTKTGTTFIDGGQIFTDSITAGQIAANAITASELAANAVTAAKIKAGEIDSTKIVSTGLDGSTVITNGTITTNKIGAKQITGAKIAADTITVGNMGPDSVDRTVIKDGEIITAKLAANAVKAGNIDAGAITADKIEAGAITIGATSPIKPGTIANSGEVVPKATHTPSGTTVFRDLVAWRKVLNSGGGIIVIKTPITFSNYMFNVEVNGYRYRSTSTVGSDVSFSIGGYAYSANGGSVLNQSFNNKGAAPISGMMYKTDDTVPVVAIVLWPTDGIWSYPQLNVTEASIGGTPPDTLKSGWSIEHYADETILATWQRYTPSLTLDQAENTRITDGWRYNGTTTINGGRIEADTITAAQIRAGSITIGPNAPIAPGTVAIPSDVSTAKTEAINAAASDATTKANNAKTGAESTAKTYTDTTVAPINTTIGNWKYGNTTFINGGSIYTRTITADKIKANDITANEIKGETITAAELAANSVIAGKIAANAVKADNLEANMIVSKNLQIRSALTINAAGGHIKSNNYNANGSAGFYMDQQQLIINQGKIKAAAIELQDSANIMPPLYASFNANASAYAVAKFWRGSLSGTTKVANDGKFGGGSVQFVITSNTGFVGMGASASDLNIPIEGGNQYIISFYVSNRSSKVITLQPQLYQTSAITIKGTARSIANSTAWVRHSVVVTAPASMTRAILRFNLTAGATATFKLDGIQVEQKTGAVDTPSNWSPPGYTSIDGESITTGSISSSSTARTNSAIAAWSIDTHGRARFGDVTVNGKIIVGEEVSNKEATSIQSDTYSAGLAGWAIKGNGDVEFNDGTFRGVLNLASPGAGESAPTLTASVRPTSLYVTSSEKKTIHIAGIRGQVTGYAREEVGVDSGQYLPTIPDPNKRARYFIGPTTDRSLTIQVHDSSDIGDVAFLDNAPDDVKLSLINIGEITHPSEEPSDDLTQGFRHRSGSGDSANYARVEQASTATTGSPEDIRSSHVLSSDSRSDLHKRTSQASLALNSDPAESNAASMNLSVTEFHESASGIVSDSAEYVWSPQGMSYPGTATPFMPTAASILWDWSALSASNRPYVGGDYPTRIINAGSWGRINTGEGRSYLDRFEGPQQKPLRGSWISEGSPHAYKDGGGRVRWAGGGYIDRTGPSNDFYLHSSPLGSFNHEVTATLSRWNVAFGIGYAAASVLVCSYDPVTKDGIFFRYRDQSKDIPAAAIYVRKNGVTRTIWSSSNRPNYQNYEHKLTRDGNTVRGYLNGTLVATVTDSNLPTGEHFGFAVEAGQMKEIHGKALVPGSGAHGILEPTSININNRRGITINTNGTINIDTPGYYMISIAVVAPFGGYRDRQYWLALRDNRGERAIGNTASRYHSDGFGHMHGAFLGHVSGPIELVVISNGISNQSRMTYARVEIARVA